MRQNIHLYVLLILTAIAAIVIFKLANDALGWQVCSQTRMDDPAFEQMHCKDALKKHYGAKQ